MKKILAIVLCLAMLVSAAACGSSGGSSSGGSSNAPQYDLRLASNLPIDDMNCGAVEEMISDIEARTIGNVKITFYPASQLGDYPLVYEEVMRGTIDMAVGSVPSTFDEKLEMDHIPYLITDYDDLPKVFTPGTTLYEGLTKLHANLGVTYLGASICSFMIMGYATDPGAYGDPTVKKDILIRVPDSSEAIRLITEDLGYMTTNIAYGDIYTSMQTGVCDGTSGMPSFGLYYEFRDVIKYAVDYNYLVEDHAILINTKLLEGMPEEYQKIIREAAQDLSKKTFSLAKEQDEAGYKALEDAGIKVLRLTDSERAAIEQSAREHIWPGLEKIYGKEFFDNLKKDLGI